MDLATGIINNVPPAYVIYRDPVDLKSQPIFFPPKDSDELFDALRGAFPHLRTHSERMREAMIKFLIEEQRSETSPLTEHSWPSMTSSSFSSPDSLLLNASNFDSPRINAPQMTRAYSSAPSTTETAGANPSPQTPLEAMTGVFSISAIGQPKQRTRRKMTNAEKIEYRKRRMVKACDSCAKRKRKCSHNQPEMERLTPKQKSPKRSIDTLASKTTTVDNPVVCEVLDPTWSFDTLLEPHWNDPLAGDMQLFDDFTCHDPIDTAFEQPPQWGYLDAFYSDTGLRLDMLNANHMAVLEPCYGAKTSDGLGSDMQQTTGGRNLWTSTDMNNANSSLAHKDTRLVTGSPHELVPWSHLEITNADEVYTPQPREHLRIASHTHGLSQPSASSSHTREHASKDGHGRSTSPRLAQTVLQLHGTARAIRTFGNLLSSNGPNKDALQLVPLANVATAIAYSTPSVAGIVAYRERHSKTSGQHQTRGSNRDARPVAATLLESMQIREYLRMNVNNDNRAHQIGRGGQALPNMVEGSTGASSSETLASTSAPLFSDGTACVEPLIHSEERPFALSSSEARRMPVAVVPSPILQTAISMFHAKGGLDLRPDVDGTLLDPSVLLTGDSALDSWLFDFSTFSHISEVKASTQPSGSQHGARHGALQRLQASTTGTRFSNDQEVYEVRNKDTFRHRDHFGRLQDVVPTAKLPAEAHSTPDGSSWHSLSALAILSSLLLLFSMLSNVNGNFYVVLLSVAFMVLPRSHKENFKVWHWRDPRHRPQHQVENSAWRSLPSRPSAVSTIHRLEQLKEQGYSLASTLTRYFTHGSKVAATDSTSFAGCILYRRNLLSATS